MVTRRARFHKFDIYRVKLIGAEIGALNAQRLNRGGHGALTVYVNLHAESEAEPARLEHAATKGRSAHGGLHGLGEVFPASHERAPRFWVEQEDFIITVARPHMDRIASFQRSQRHAFKQCADLNDSI